MGSLNLSSKQSAVNVGYPDIPVCFTDLISSVEYAVTVLIVLGKSKPLMINCSPTENVPEVCLRLMVDDAPPAATAKPLAPLLFLLRTMSLVILYLLLKCLNLQLYKFGYHKDINSS